MNQSEVFRALHHRGKPFLMPNPWDIGTARLMEALGFEALATTSAGHAASMGKTDSRVTKSEILTHAQELVGSIEIPLSADLENCFAHDPEGVGHTITQAASVGLAGGSVEDYSIDDNNPIYELNHAVERVAAAVEAAKPTGFVVTARAENHIRGIQDFDDTLTRLVAYAQAGADCVYAPGANSPSQIQQIVQATGLPVNVLALPGSPSVPELAELGVARVSVGSGFSLVAMGAVVKASKELLEKGTTSWWSEAAPGEILKKAFRDRPADPDLS